MRPLRIVAAALFLAGAAGCTIERTPHLYPANDVASKTGVVEGRFVGHGNLHGTAEITMPDGEILQGEYSIVAGGSANFGSVFGAVYGRGGTASIAGSSVGVGIDASGQGQASLYGTHGTSAQCEFLNNNLTGHGYGACRLSTGGLYRLQY